MAKAGKPRFKLNRKAFGEVMRLTQPAVSAQARQVAESVQAQLPNDVPVDTMDTVSQDGRPVTLVTVMHPSGLARQANDGVLTRAAAQNGLEVTRYPLGD